MPRRPSIVDNEVVARCPAGHALVLRCYPLRRGSDPPEPFPTLFWLDCPEVVRGVARLEYSGRIDAVRARIRSDPDFRRRVHADHRAYVAERWSLLTPDDRARLERADRSAALRERGIGGVRDRDTVKCLHLHLAHHLARGSAIGAWVWSWGALRLCPVGGGDGETRAQVG